MPYSTFRKLGKSADDLIKTNMLLNDFNGNPSEEKGVLYVELTIESKTLLTAFFVTDIKDHTACFLAGIGSMQTTVCHLQCTKCLFNGMVTR